MKDEPNIELMRTMIKVTFIAETLITIVNYCFVELYNTSDLILTWGLAFFALFLYKLAKTSNEKSLPKM